MPLVSVIIPIYNKELRLKDTIKCVLSQTFKDFELILIDDGSTDNSAKIALDYKKEDLRIKYYSQENRGVSVARNRGIELAQGEYITFLDADDRWADNFLEEMTKIITELDACYCGHYYVSGGEKIKAKMKHFKGDIFEPYINNICTPNTNSWLIKKDFLTQNNIVFPEGINWGEDMIFFSKVLLRTDRIDSVKQNLTEYYIECENNLSVNNLEKINKHIIWMDILKEYINNTEKNEKRRRRFNKVIDSYRLPAGIVYRLLDNFDTGNLKNLFEIYKTNEKYIEKIKINNGLRSFKLYYFSKILKIKIYLVREKMT